MLPAAIRYFVIVDFGQDGGLSSRLCPRCGKGAQPARTVGFGVGAVQMRVETTIFAFYGPLAGRKLRKA